MSGRAGVADKLWDTFSTFRVRHEYLRATESGGVLPGAHHPPRCGLTVGCGLGIPECRRCRVRVHHRAKGLGKFDRTLFETVDARPVVGSRLEGRDARRMHARLRQQLLYMPNIHGTPDAARSSRRKSARVSGVVNALYQPVDPSEAERLAHSLCPCHMRPTGIHAVESHHKFGGRVVVRFQPRAKLRCRREVSGRRHGRFRQGTTAFAADPLPLT